MRLPGSCQMFFTFVTMLASSLAYGATTSTVIPFPSSAVLNPCNGEQVNVGGNIHLSAGVTTDGSGGLHLRSHINNQDVSGIGATTGSRYQLPSTSHTSAYLGKATTFTATLNSRFVAQGSTPNFSLRQVFHITVDANGVPAVSVSDFRT
ncbi:MAG: hypothetical protein ACREA0_27230, partial [bacterium]